MRRSSNPRPALPEPVSRAMSIESPRQPARLLRLIAIAATATFLVPALSSGGVAASPVDDQRAEVERIADELERLHMEADKFGELYNGYVHEQRQLQDEIAAAEEDLAAKEKEVAKVRDNLSAVAVDAFVKAGSGGLSPVFQDSESFNDAMQADQYSKVALSVGTSTTDDLDEVVRELDEETEALESKREQAEDLAEQAASAKEQAESSKTEYQTRYQEAKAELGRLIEEEEQRRAEEAYQRMLAEQQEAQEAQEAAAAVAAAEQESETDVADGSVESSASDSDSSSSGGGGAAPQGFGNVETTPEPPVSSGPSSAAQTAINAAMSQLGVPYQYASSSPGVAFDCSGLTSYAWGVAGVSLTPQSAAQYGQVPHVSVSEAQPGDLLFYYSPISHVGIYLGNGQLVHAPNSGSVVSVASVSWDNVVGVGRPA